MQQAPAQMAMQPPRPQQQRPGMWLSGRQLGCSICPLQLVMCGGGDEGLYEPPFGCLLPCTLQGRGFDEAAQHGLGTPHATACSRGPRLWGVLWAIRSVHVLVDMPRAQRTANAAGSVPRSVRVAACLGVCGTLWQHDALA